MSWLLRTAIISNSSKGRSHKVAAEKTEAKTAQQQQNHQNPKSKPSHMKINLEIKINNIRTDDKRQRNRNPTKIRFAKFVVTIVQKTIRRRSTGEVPIGRLVLWKGNDWFYLIHSYRRWRLEYVGMEFGDFGGSRFGMINGYKDERLWSMILIALMALFRLLWHTIWSVFLCFSRGWTMIMLCHWRTGILPRNRLCKRSQRWIVLLTTESQDSVIILSPCQVKRSNCCMQSRCLVISGSLTILIVFGQDLRKGGSWELLFSTTATYFHHVTMSFQYPSFNSFHSAWCMAVFNMSCYICVILARTFLPKICL